MIGLVLVTHGRLAAEFIVAMEHVVGPQERIAAICIGPDDDMEARRKRHRQGDRQGRRRRRRDHPHRPVRRHPLQPRHQPDEVGQDRGDRRRQPADADPPRGRAQDDGRRAPPSPPRARRGANISRSRPKSWARRRPDDGQPHGGGPEQARPPRPRQRQVRHPRLADRRRRSRSRRTAPGSAAPRSWG